MPELSLFVSHRSSDTAVAKALVNLFEKALKLPARQVRCTSVDGYRLAVGADTDEQLRREVFEARAFIGIITPESITSPYVLFELGARWGARRHLAPVLARGADSTSLGGPLAGINALRITERPQVIQLVEDISEYLQLPLEPAPSFQDAIDAAVSHAAEVTNRAKPSRSRDESAAISIDETEVRILEFVAHASTHPKPSEIAGGLGLKLEKANCICLPQAGCDWVTGGDWILEHGLESLKSGATLLMASLDDAGQDGLSRGASVGTVAA